MSGSASDDGRQRGRIEERGKTLRVIVHAGTDPVTGKRVYLRETINGTSPAAYKRARSTLNKLLTQVDSQRSAPSSVPLSHALNEWMRTSEIEDSTRQTYQGYIDRTIRPVLGDEAVNKITARTLENFYTDLRRCRVRCDGKPFIEKHRTTGDHDCQAAKCSAHVCKPMAASSIRQIHAIVSGTLDAAERWNWISSQSRSGRAQASSESTGARPADTAEAARLSEEAFLRRHDRIFPPSFDSWCELARSRCYANKWGARCSNPGRIIAREGIACHKRHLLLRLICSAIYMVTAKRIRC